MRYFKVQKSYDVNDFIPIDETELDKAFYAFLTDSKIAFKNGACSRIDSIIPDYHRAMGWNYGYKIQGEDWSFINKDLPDYNGFLEESKMRVRNLIDAGKVELIGSSDLKEIN